MAPTHHISSCEHSSGQPSLLESCSPTEGTVPEVRNEKVELDEGLSWSTTEQQVALLQMEKTLPNFSSTNKRPYTDTSIETSYPCKAPRKPLKLFIPKSKANNGGEKRIGKPSGVYSRKTNSCTITSADLNFAPGSNS